MTQLAESQTESDNSTDALLTWTAVLRLRDFLEKAMTNRPPQPQDESGPCRVWLHNFAKSQFQACTALVEEELMKILPATMSEAEMQEVQSIFNSVLELELALLDSAYARNRKNLEPTQQSNSPWHPSNIIFTTDFDVTCTIVDSCETLVRAAECASIIGFTGRSGRGDLFKDYEAALDRHSERTRRVLESLGNPEGMSEVPSSTSLAERCDLVPGMDPLLKPFFDNVRSSLAPSPDKESPDAPFSEAGLRTALTALADLEVLCNQDIMATGVLAGSTREGIRTEAKRVNLRVNCPRLLQQLVQIGTAVHIVSANWSRDLIIGGLPELPKGKLFVHCNDLLFDDSGVSRGVIDMTVVNAFDKERMLRALRLMYSYLGEIANLPADETKSPKIMKSQPGVKSESDRKADKMMVYMGDSHTDILALLEADLGIVIGDSAAARLVMSTYGIQLLPLVEASAYLSLGRLNGSERSWRRSGILFEAGGWADVEACLFGRLEDPSSETMTSGSLTSSPSNVEPLPNSGENPQDRSGQRQPRFENSNAPAQERLPTVNLELLQVAC